MHGLSAVVAGAMLMGILNLGMRDAFDAVYGASAGAINSTYFLSSEWYQSSMLMQPLSSLQHAYRRAGMSMRFLTNM